MRLIDADRLGVILASYKGYDKDSFIAGMNAVTDVIDSAPTVDAVGVVRCGECKYSHPYMLGLYRCDRTDIALATGKDEYCSRGERKEDVSN